MILGLWTGLGVLLIMQSYVATAADGRNWTIEEHMLTVVSQLYRGWMWAALTPGVFWLRRELGRRHTNRVAEGAMHGLAALAIFAFGNVLRIWLVEVSFGYWEARYYSLPMVYNSLGAYSLIDFYIYWAVLGAAYVSDLNWQKRQTALREEQLRTQLAQAELAALKQQVQPHFLFNSLNAVSSLMREGEGAKAVEALAQLSTLLRQLMAHAGHPEIELRRELDYAQCYLSVEKVRFEERLLMAFDAEEECLGAAVPTLILQPLVENAVKHGIAQRRHPGCITVTAHRVGDRLRLRIANDPAEGGSQAVANDSHGIGLRATRERLRHHFGDDHRFDCIFRGPEGTVVTIELPFHRTPIPQSPHPTHG